MIALARSCTSPPVLQPAFARPLISAATVVAVAAIPAAPATTRSYSSSSSSSSSSPAFSLSASSSSSSSSSSAAASFSSTSTGARLKRKGRAAPTASTASSRDPDQGWRSSLRSQLSAALQGLQGDWCDDDGRVIEIHGDAANFQDGTGVWLIEEQEGQLYLRGSKLVGEAHAPIWRKVGSGEERRWARAKLDAPDRSFSESFWNYKEGRVRLRRSIHAAFAEQDFDLAFRLRAAWEAGGISCDPADTPTDARLLRGQELIPGTCFRHRKYGYSAVILAGEPWCNAPGAWRAKMGVPSLPNGETQPFYHSLINEGERPGGHISFVAEENIEATSLIYPLPGPLTQLLFDRSDVLGCYLPGQMLEAVLKKQQGGQGFSI